jgi:hypothetical protein
LDEEQKAYRREKRREREADLAKRDFVRAGMGHRQGREFFYWLLGITGLKSNPFTTNALSTAFRCGEANIGQQIEGLLIEVAPKLYLEMLEEQESGRSRTDDSDPADNPGDGAAQD